MPGPDQIIQWPKKKGSLRKYSDIQSFFDFKDGTTTLYLNTNVNKIIKLSNCNVIMLKGVV